MKKFTKKTVQIVAICFATLFFTAQVNGQTAPIQNGSSNYNGDLYHNGDIGLGINSPSARLHISRPSYSNPNGNIWSNDYLKIENHTISGGFPPTFGTETKFIVAGTGNVGIGAATPSEKLHVEGRVRIQNNFGSTRIGAYNGDFFHFLTDLPRFYFQKQLTINGGISSYSTNDLIFQTNNNGSTKARIKHSTGDFILYGGDFIIENPSGLGSGTNQIALNSDGIIKCREVQVDLGVIPDYVFAEDYNLMPLEEVKAFIEANKHLPNVKSEAEFKEQGSISLTEMNLKLLEKVEELTLYILQQEERIKALEDNGGVK